MKSIYWKIRYKAKRYIQYVNELFPSFDPTNEYPSALDFNDLYIIGHRIARLRSRSRDLIQLHKDISSDITYYTHRGHSTGKSKQNVQKVEQELFEIYEEYKLENIRKFLNIKTLQVFKKEEDYYTWLANRE